MNRHPSPGTRPLAAAVAALALAGAAGQASGAGFTILGVLGPDPDKQLQSVAFSISGDGGVVVGTSSLPDGSTAAFRWTEGTGMTNLGTGSAINGFALGVSADGSVIAGSTDTTAANPNYQEAARWTAAGGPQGLGDLPGGQLHSYATSLSADGSVIVGCGNNAAGTQAVRWNSAGSISLLGNATGVTESCAIDVSADGSTIIGSASLGYTDATFRWTTAGGMTLLAPPAGVTSVASALSADGSVIVGALGSTPQEAFRWTEQSGYVGLGGLLAAGKGQSYASGVSGNGGRVVGSAAALIPGGTGDVTQAFLWTEATGMLRLADLLINAGVTGLDDQWLLESALGISPDGRWVVGTAVEISPQGNSYHVAYRADLSGATVPAPPAVLLLGTGLLAAMVRARCGRRAGKTGGDGWS